MNAIPRSTNDDSKRWLVLLAAATAASIAFLGYSIVRGLSPTKLSVEAPQKPALAEQAATRSEPDWNGTPAGQVADDSHSASTRPDPFAAQDAAAAKAAAANDPVVIQQAVHHQAEYLRDLIAKGKVPESLGNLTKEKVDQMEKDGIMIN